MLACVIALAFGAAAQDGLNFTDRPLMSSPTQMPNGYGELNWTNIFHLDPAQWGIIKQIVFQTPGGGDMVLCDL